MATRFPILALTGILAAGLGHAWADGHPRKKGARNVETQSDSLPDAQCPFSLALARVEGPGLRLTIRNRAAMPQVYLHGPALQPSLLLIRGGDGKRYVARDDRKVKKQNQTPEPEDYLTLAPGATDSLYEADFERGSGGYSLKWGPYLYVGLSPGSYRVRAEWRSAQDAWKDPETGKRGKISGLWKGKAESNEAVVVLP